MNNKLNLNYLITNNRIVINYEGKSFFIDKSDKKYNTIKGYIIEGKNEDIIDLLIPKKMLIKFSNKYFTVSEDEKLFLNDDLKNAVEPLIAETLLSFVEEGLPVTPVVNFWRKLRENPSEESKSDLYTFLTKNHHPLTPDGDFIAYKKVTEKDGKLVDSHSRKMSNEVGTVVSMPREKVCADRNVTCASGLHVASWSYAANFSGNILVEVLVNPKNVVSVPTDYNSQKMRTCEYTVLRRLDKESEARTETLAKDVKSTIEPKPVSNSTCIKIEDEDAVTNVVPTIKTKPQNLEYELSKKTAREIIKDVKDLTGEEITLSLKNKKSIIKKAITILSNYTDAVNDALSDAVNDAVKNNKSSVHNNSIESILSGKTAKEIIEAVEDLTGEEITLSLKNKKSIIKKAKTILSEYGWS